MGGGVGGWIVLGGAGGGGARYGLSNSLQELFCHAQLLKAFSGGGKGWAGDEDENRPHYTSCLICTIDYF